MLTPEKRFATHSMDYYTCFQHLIEEKDIKLYGNSSYAYGLGKVLGKSSEKEVEDLFNEMNLTIQQFKPVTKK